MARHKPLDGLTVGWDLDGVFYDFVSGFISHLEKKGYANLPYAETWSFYSNQWGWSRDKFLKEYAEAIKDGLFTPNPAHEIGSANSVLARAAELGARNVIVTARNISGARKEAHLNTMKWVEHHNLQVDEVYFREDKTSVPTDFFIEDNIDNYLQLRNKGTRSYLFNQPWNKVAEDTHRVFSHDEFVDKIVKEAIDVDVGTTRTV